MKIKKGTTLDVSLPAAAGGAGTECSKGIQE